MKNDGKYVKFQKDEQKNFLLEVRSRLSITWLQLAEILTVNKGLIYVYLNESSKMPYSSFIKLCKKAKINPNRFRIKIITIHSMKELKLDANKIRELYWKEGLSLRQIGKKYGYCMATIKNFMIRNNIPRRPTRKRELVKPSKACIKNLYENDKASIEKISKEFGVALSTVFRWMKDYGIERRSTEKYKKFPFSSDLCEKAYLQGLRCGDISVNKIYNLICARSGTTHPSMIQLFNDAFKRYGTPCRYPTYNKITKRYGWHLYISLDESFKFLVNKETKIENDNYFYYFLAGFFDCEGCLFIYDNHGYIGLSALIYNNDKKILQKIYRKLEADGFNPKFYRVFKKGEKMTNNYYRGGDTFAVVLHTRKDVIRFIKKIPIRHSEKIRKANIVLNITKEDKWTDISEEVLMLRNQIKEETKNCVMESVNEWRKKH